MHERRDNVLGTDVLGNFRLALECANLNFPTLETFEMALMRSFKLLLTHARTEEALFLGTRLKVGTGAEAKLTLQTNMWGKKLERRSTGWETIMKAPLPKLLKRLSDRGFCTKEGKPIAKSGWAFLDTEQVILLYSSVNRGMLRDN